MYTSLQNTFLLLLYSNIWYAYEEALYGFGTTTRVGYDFLKSRQEKSPEARPTSKTLMGHPGEPAGSCLLHYPSVYNSTHIDRGLCGNVSPRISAALV